jgi:hypothetical protein
MLIVVARLTLFGARQALSGSKASPAGHTKPAVRSGHSASPVARRTAAGVFTELARFGHGSFLRHLKLGCEECKPRSAPGQRRRDARGRRAYRARWAAMRLRGCQAAYCLRPAGGMAGNQQKQKHTLARLYRPPAYFPTVSTPCQNARPASVSVSAINHSTRAMAALEIMSSGGSDFQFS